MTGDNCRCDGDDSDDSDIDNYCDSDYGDKLANSYIKN
jgi:hypothetical protein